MRKGNFVAERSIFHPLVRKNATSAPAFLSSWRVSSPFNRGLMHDYSSGHAVYAYDQM